MDTFLDSFPSRQDATSHPAAMKGIIRAPSLAHSTITLIPVNKLGKAPWRTLEVERPTAGINVMIPGMGLAGDSNTPHGRPDLDRRLYARAISSIGASALRLPDRDGRHRLRARPQSGSIASVRSLTVSHVPQKSSGRRPPLRRSDRSFNQPEYPSTVIHSASRHREAMPGGVVASMIAPSREMGSQYLR